MIKEKREESLIRKNTKTFGMFLKRQKIPNSYALAMFLISKFSVFKKSGYNTITMEELRDRDILPCEKYKTFTQWRTEMLKSGILTCMASTTEIHERIPNYKASQFKVGPKIEKYINNFNLQSLPQNFGLKCLEIDTKFEEVDNKFDTMDIKVTNLEKELRAVTSLLLKMSPPDNDMRREIIRNNFEDLDKCMDLLIDNNERKVYLKEEDIINKYSVH